MARAIDADVFIRDLTAMKKMYDAIELDGMIKALKDAPTIDTVKHGKWIFDGKRIKGGVDWWHCSECLAMENGVYAGKPYCSNCGARMDGE